jgi:hypothetical protein
MANISWDDKDKNATDGISNKWRDSDANAVKTAVNSKDELAGGNRLIRLGACVLKCADNTVASTSFTWSILNNSTHEPLFFTGISANVSGQLELTYPAVAEVMGFTIVPDETFSAQGIYVGASVGLDVAIIDVYKNCGFYGGHLIGNGTTGYTQGGDLSSFSISIVSAGEFLFNPPKTSGTTDASNSSELWKHATVNYVGPNNYRIQRLFTGLGSYAFRYKIIDNATGLAITTNSTSDVIEITSAVPKIVRLNMNVNDANGWPGSIIKNTGNFWVKGLYKLSS